MFKKNIKLLFLLNFLFLLFLFPITIFAKSVNEDIESYQVNIQIQANRQIIVTENIEYDFKTNKHHGIYRNLPLSTKYNGESRYMDYKVLSILRDGQKEQYKISHNRGKNEFLIRIGNPNQTISGIHKYHIVYQTNQAITFYKDHHSEFYWNVIGNFWKVPIKQASLKLSMPNNDLSSIFKNNCYTGKFGSTKQDCVIKKENNKLIVNSNNPIPSGNALTVALKIKPGVIQEPELIDKIRIYFIRYGFYLIPLLTLIILFVIWFKYGRETEYFTVIAEYEPPLNLSPFEIGQILNIRSQLSVVGTIIEMARKGNLKIKYKKRKKFYFWTSQEYILIKKNEPKLEWEKILWNKLFKKGEREEINLKDLPDDFYETVSSAEKKVKESVQKLNLNDQTAEKVIFKVINVLIIVILIFTISLMRSVSDDIYISLIATILIIMFFLPLLIKKTKEGARLIARIKGFKLFLSVTEKERYKFYNAPQKTPEEFMRFLPYAIVFRVEKKWAKQFKDINLSKPEWLESDDMTSFSAFALASAMHSFGSSGNLSSSSSGGGFSGGGGGGGGGGSW